MKLLTLFLVIMTSGYSALLAQSVSPNLSQLSWVGEINAIHNLQLNAKVGGRVEKVYLAENKKVRQGDLLLRLENEVQQIQVEIAKQQIVLRQYQVQEARANYENISQKLKEEQELYQRGSSTKSQLDSIELQYVQREVAFRNAEVYFTLAKKELELKEQAYRDTFVISPMNGILAKVHVDQGEIINSGTVLFQLLDMSKVEIEVGALQQELTMLKPGMTVYFTTPAYPKMRFKGILNRIHWSADSSSRRFPFFIYANNQKRFLRSGMTAKIYLE